MLDEQTTDKYFDAIEREVTFARFLSEPVVVVWWLITANILLWVAAKLYGLYLVDYVDFPSVMAVEQLAFFPGLKINEAIEEGQVWRLLSSNYVHLNFLHIGFNAYGIYILGPILEKFYGARRFLVLYTISGLVGAWASWQFNDVPSGGASGAVYGLVGALLVFGFKYRARLPARVSRAFTLGMLPWVAISIAIGFFEALPFDNAGHIGGLIGGGVLAMVLGTKLRKPLFRGSHIVLTLSAAACVVMLVLTTWFWSEETVRCTESIEAFESCYPQLIEDVKLPE